MTRVAILLALAAIGCGDKFSAEGSGGAGGSPAGRAMGAAELRLSPPRADIPNIGGRTACAAGTTGTYTYFLGTPSSALTVEERVLGAMRPDSRDLRVECSIVETDEALFVSASISGTDVNSRRVSEVSLSFAGTINQPADFGALESAEVSTADTGTLTVDPFVSSCVLSDITHGDVGEFWALFSCPAVVGESESDGCAVSGAVSFRGCSR